MPSGRLGRPFVLLFTSSTISNLGDGVTIVALPLLVATLTRDPTTVAGLALVSRLPWLLFALPVGALTDRLDRKRVMCQANLFRAAAMGGLAVAVATDTITIWLLYALALLIGIAEVFYDNSAQAFLPQIVAPALLARANGRLFAAATVTNEFAGPPLGALMFSAAVAAPFVLDATSFAVTVPLLWAIAGRFRPATEAGAAPRHLGREIMAGLRWLWSHRLLRLLAILLGLANFANTAAFSILVLFAQDELGASDVEFGLLITAGAVGAVAGGLLAGRVTDRFGSGPALVATFLTFAVVQTSVGLVSQLWVVAALFAVNGVATIVWNVITVSLRQTVIPPALLGRVNSVYRFVGWGAIPLGALAGGLLAAAIGLRGTYVVTGLALVAVGLAAAPLLLRSAAELDSGATSSLDSVAEGDQAPAVHHDGGAGDPAS